MLLTDRRAAVRLLWKFLNDNKLTFSLCRVLAMRWIRLTQKQTNAATEDTWMYSSTASKDNSLSKGRCLEGGAFEATSLPCRFVTDKWVIREPEIEAGLVNRSYLAKCLPSIQRGFSQLRDCFGVACLRTVTDLQHLLVRQRSEGYLNKSAPCERDVKGSTVVPANHSIVRNRTTQWGRGSVVLSTTGRELNTNLGPLAPGRSYSTKTSLSAPSRRDNKVLERLQLLWEQNRTNPEFKTEGLFRLMREIDLWIAAYKKLSLSTGGPKGPQGGDSQTIDGMSLKTLECIRDQVIQGKYRFGITPQRGVTIPKPNGGERPLGIPTFQDRLVQEVVRILLEVVYEPRFSNHSHGFRPGRSQHTALRHIRKDFNGVSWYVEGEIAKFFDTVNHEVLIRLLEKRIDDKRFLTFVGHMLKTKIGTTTEEGKKILTNFIGTPQGGVVSPLLSNVVLDELDVFMEELIREFNRDNSRARNSEYDKLWRRGGAKLARTVNYGKAFDPNFRRMGYVRYADDFVVGIIGSRDEALVIKNRIAEFLRETLKLELHPNKTLVTNPRVGKVRFLGYILGKSVPKPYVYSRMYNRALKTVRVLRGDRVYLKMDIFKVVQRLATKGYCDKSGVPKPNFIHLPESQSATLQKVGWIIRGLERYYHLAESKRQELSRTIYILQHSTAMLLAAKFKLGSRSQVFKIAGKDLSGPIKTKHPPIGVTDSQLEQWEEQVSGTKRARSIPAIPFVKYSTIPKPDLKPLNSRFGELQYKPLADNNVLPDPLATLSWRTMRGCYALDASCAICGSTMDVEMHHVRGLKYPPKGGTTPPKRGGSKWPR